MSDDPNHALEALRLRERTLELEAVDVRARVAEVRSLIEMLEHGTRRRPGRPRRIDIVPQRLSGALAETPVEENIA